MKAFIQFIIENFVATAVMIAGGIVSIIEIVKHLKDPHDNMKKRYLYVSGAIFAVAFIYLIIQYILLDEPSDSPNKDDLTHQTEREFLIETEKTEVTETTKEVGSEDVEINIEDVEGTIVIGGTNHTIIEETSGNKENSEEPAPKPQVQTPVTVSSVTLNKRSLKMKVGTSEQLKATVLYSNNSSDESVLWVSSDEKIATVDKNGVVIAHAAGTVEIIAQATRGNSSKEARCTIVVNNPPSGYDISLSTDVAFLYENFYVYVEPYNEDVEITLYAKAPSGAIDELKYTEEKKYYIETEVGVWTIYADVKNDAGVYEASKPEDFVTIEIMPINFEIEYP